MTSHEGYLRGCVGWTLALGLLFPSAARTDAHEQSTSNSHAKLDGATAHWQFRPHYAFPGRAKYSSAPHRTLQSADDEAFARESLPLRLFGNMPTQRRRNLLDPKLIPRRAFSFEAWINSHVNQPIGAAAVAGGPQSPTESGWALAYHTLTEGGSRVVALFGHPDPDQRLELSYEIRPDEGFKEYWRHVVLTYDGDEIRLYVNGEQRASKEFAEPGMTMPAEPRLEIAAYLENEPEMQLANLVSQAHLYRRAIQPHEVNQRFEDLQADLQRGVVYPDGFHFTAGPYLNYATSSSIRVVWETDAPASARIEWGLSSALDESATLSDAKRIQKFEIAGLEPHTPYFYRITCISEDGEEISSGTLTFQTAVRPDEPFRFVVIGDTETRPHINHALSKKIWGERPNFVVVLGDLTDGGMRDDKWQWNHEYFSGIAGLCSRVPFYPVPGNGEADLYWYKRYHSLPDNQSPYSFCYGAAEFFMLDSNLRSTEFAPGGRQYDWLERRLQASEAAWKFVCFHHAPFSSDEDDYGDAWNNLSVHGDPDVRRLVPLFEEYGVDVVMFGHVHSYERSRRLKSLKADQNGVLYLLCGGGGGNLEDFAPNPVGFSSKVHRGHHYCLVNIEGEQLDLRVHNLDGALIDILRIDNRQAAP